MNPPIFSLLHPTARVANGGWRDATRSWLQNAADPYRVEYVLSVHESQADSPPLPINGFGSFKVVVNRARHCCVDTCNAAARASSCKVLISIADDLFPPPLWDAKLLSVIPDIDSPWVVEVGCTTNPDLMISQVMTRAMYELPGRGGCNGEWLYTEYLSMGADDDFTEYMRLLYPDRIVRAPHVVFDHRHHSNGGRSADEIDRWHSGRPEVWEIKNRVLARRRADGFSR